LTFKRAGEGAALEEEAGQLLEVEQEATDDVEDVDYAWKTWSLIIYKASLAVFPSSRKTRKNYSKQHFAL
jgi:hypothetical protein